MKLELIWSNEAEVEGVSVVLAAIAMHRRRADDLVNFASLCDINRKYRRKAVDDVAAQRMEWLSRAEQEALTVVAAAPVKGIGDNQAKALYLAELIEADAECITPEDLVIAFRSLAQMPS